jgi:predicted phage tail protein
MRTMREVRLYGHLRKKFGKSFKFAISTAAEAISALRATVPGFEKYMIANSEPGYRVYVDDDIVPKAELLKMKTSAKVIKIVPVVAGAGGKGAGIFGIILGIVLIVVTWGAATPLVAGVTVAQVGMSIGASLILSGISSLLADHPKSGAGGTGRPANQPSFAFNGAVNSAAQGNAIPVCYGQMLCGSQVVSAGFSVDELPPEMGGGGSGPGPGTIIVGGEFETSWVTTIPASPPYRVDVAAHQISLGSTFKSNISVHTVADDLPLQEIPYDPDTGPILNEYMVNNGLYIFSASENGVAIEIQYNYRNGF